jgi:molybdopterin molybdotransferase
MQKSVTPEQARDILYALDVTTHMQTVHVADALGRVLAEDIVAAIPIPPFDRSPYDGYAFRGEDTSGASAENPVTLAITEELPAGTAPTIDVTPGTAAKILTGAPLPVGANATIKYELTEFTDTEVKILAPVAPNTDVVRAGDDVAAGTVIATAGTVVSPPLMGLIASVGKTDVLVYRRPSAIVINTGTELCEPGEPLKPAMIYNSSVFTLTGYLAKMGVDAVNGGVVRDDADEIAAKIESALSRYDLVITTGGASVGDYDCALRASAALGAQVLYWKTTLKPGGAMVASVKGGKLILALSGNPAASVMGLQHISAAYIKKLAGRTDCLPKSVEVYLKEPFNKPSKRTRLLRGRLEIIGGTAYFAERGEQGGGSISSFLECDMLGELPAGSPPLPSGTKIKAYIVEN